MAQVGATVVTLGIIFQSLCCESFRTVATPNPSKTLNFSNATSTNMRSSLAEEFQTKDWANPPTIFAFTIKDSGDSRVNGNYVEAGRKRGKPRYEKWRGMFEDSVVMEWSQTRTAWRLYVNNIKHYGRQTLYLNKMKTDTFPRSGWAPWHGKEPVPLVRGLDGKPNARRILIAHASIGSGHKSAARAIQEQLKLDMPNAEVILFDVIEKEIVQFDNGIEEIVVPPNHFTLFSKHGFLKIRSVTPAITDAITDLMDEKGLWDFFKIPGLGDEHLKLSYQYSVIENILFNMRQFEKFVLRHRWDLIINTHFFPSITIGALRERSNLNIPVVTVITDFHAHKIWLASTDQYFVAANQVRNELHDGFDVPAMNITVSGIPISPRIKTVTKWQAHEAAIDSGILVPYQRGGRLVLAMPVAENTDNCILVWQQLLVFAHAHQEHTVVAVAGRKDDLREAFMVAANRTLPVNFKLLGFTRKLPELMAISDIIVSKPGGLTTAEALASGLPFLLIENWIIDVERPNAEFLLSKGAAISVSELKNIPDKLMTVFSENVSTQNIPIELMQHSAKSLGYPSSAAMVSEYVQRLFHIQKLQEFAPGICCCGETKWGFAPWVENQKSCRFFHAPYESEPLVASEHTQDECSFSWGYNHAAKCPQVCNSFAHYEKFPASAEDCSSISVLSAF